MSHELPQSLLNRMTASIENNFPRTNPRGRPRQPLQTVVKGIYYRLRTGTQWRYMPREYGAPATLHLWMKRLSKNKAMKQLWKELVAESRTAGTLNDEFYLLDASIIKSPMGGDYTGKSPVHRGRLGAKRSLLTDGDGLPLAILSSKANRNDRTLFTATIAASVAELRPGSVLKMDKGYSGQEIKEWTERKYGIAVNVPPHASQEQKPYDISGRSSLEPTARRTPPITR